MKEEKSKEIILIDDKKIEQMETDTKDKYFSSKEKIFYILKGISSISSAIIHNLGYSSLWVLGYTTIYLISFRRHFNTNINFPYSYNYIPLMNVAYGLASPTSGRIEDKYGSRKTIFISSLVICISFIIMYFSRSLYLDYILMCLIGFGIALGINISKKNACSFFMNRKALICGIINLFSNAFSFFLIVYYEIFILNYDMRYPYLDNFYFGEEIFINYQKLIIFQILLILSTGLFSLILFFKNAPKETIKFGFNEKAKTEENKNGKDEIEKKKIPKNLKIKKAINNKRTIRLIIILFLFFPMINIINGILRMDFEYYFFFGAFYYASGCISSIIFGIIGDCVQFRILFVILSILLSFTSFIYIYYFEEPFILLLITILVSFIDNSFNIIFDSHIMKVYEMENYIYIWGIIRASGRVSEIIGILFNLFLNIRSSIYKIIYGIFGVFNLISIYIGLFETEDKFKYEN